MTLPTEPWPVHWSCTEVSTESPAATGRAALAATQILWPLSGSQFGHTTVTWRPCRRACDPTLLLPDAWDWGWPYPALVGGAWVNLGCGACGPDGCACASLQDATLPGRVYDVTQVKVDGVVVSGSAYRLDRDPRVSGTLLVRLDGGSWPVCQQLALDDTQVGTWSATVRYGLPVPVIAQLAAGELACEFLKGFNGVDCRIPQQVVSLARQGVTLNFPDPTQLLQAGKFGLPTVDRFLHAVNPQQRRRRARVVSPDTLGLRQADV